MGAALVIESLFVGYGKVQVLHGVSLEADEGRALAIVGPNGAGKTTLLRAISGFLPATTGEVSVFGQRVEHVPAYRLVTLGIAHVLQGRHIVAGMSVEDNLLLGAHTRMTRSARSSVKGTLDRVVQLFPILGERRKQSADGLSGGEQQMLAIGRALMSAPRVLLLDEPSMGLAPRVVAEIGDRLAQLKSEGLTLILVEQNPDLALALADRVVVIETGQVVQNGGPEIIEDRERVALAYLGQDAVETPVPDVESTERTEDE